MKFNEIWLKARQLNLIDAEGKYIGPKQEETDTETVKTEEKTTRSLDNSHSGLAAPKI